MNDDMLFGVILLAVAGALIFVGLPNKTGQRPRFLRFDASPVLFPPVVLALLAGGFVELIAGILGVTH